MKEINQPIAIFDSLEFIKTTESVRYQEGSLLAEDFSIALAYLKSHGESLGTFNSYRREIERLLQWCLHVSHKSLKELMPEDINNFINFCQNPPSSWVGSKKISRFVGKKSLRLPNPDWRPFFSLPPKETQSQEQKPQKTNDTGLSPASYKEMLSILESFFNFLMRRDHITVNPVSFIYQKTKNESKELEKRKIRKLTKRQWAYVMLAAERLALTNFDHERTLFLITCLYSMYLRISELCVTPCWCPAMNHFYQNSQGQWWFMVRGRKNKQREVAVSNVMLNALMRWRAYLDLFPLTPLADDDSPLFPKKKGEGGISSANFMRKLVRECFTQAAHLLHEDQFYDEAKSLAQLFPDCIHYTAIAEDLNYRPFDHVRDDAGHNSQTTHLYINMLQKRDHVEAKLNERYHSSLTKPLVRTVASEHTP